MEKITDWSQLWEELVEIRAAGRAGGAAEAPPRDPWNDRARQFKQGVRRRWERPDSSRDFILSQLDAGSTVLDIGAGTGSWAALLARRVRHVTAVEPSESMIAVMRESLEEEKIGNVSIVEGSWPDVYVEPHDFSLCSHAMYGYPDLEAFVLRMIACTRRTCFLLLRAPSLDGIRAEAARHIWGQPLDSPNFTIAYNILIEMGVYANVLMENTGLWKPRVSASIEEAHGDLKRFLGLTDDPEHDGYLLTLLRRRLHWRCGRYLWPPEVRSALVYWNVGGR
jgi:SAM-dependent methyltransferase